MGFAMAALFSDGAPGFALLNDLSTMYQDSAGTIPAALEQPLGLWLDSKYGGARGAELLSPNALTSTAGWATNSCTLAIVNGELELTATAAGIVFADFPVGTFPANTALELLATLRPGTDTAPAFVALADIGTSYPPNNPTTVTAPRRIIRHTVGPNTVFRVRLDATAIGQKAYFTTASVRPIAGNHFIQPTSANRPTLKRDAKGNYYVRFNGTNQWMQSAASVDFSGTDKVTVFAGVTKLSDAAVGAVLHHGAAGAAGIFGLLSPVSTASGTSSFRVSGADAAVVEVQTGAAAAPESLVLSGAADLAAAVGQQARIRKNGGVWGYAAATAGAGPFRSDVSYLGARSGSTLFFNGDLYCLAARGASTADALIAQAERWINSRMGGVF